MVTTNSTHSISSVKKLAVIFYCRKTTYGKLYICKMCSRLNKLSRYHIDLITYGIFHLDPKMQCNNYAKIILLKAV